MTAEAGMLALDVCSKTIFHAIPSPRQILALILLFVLPSRNVDVVEPAVVRASDTGDSVQHCFGTFLWREVALLTTHVGFNVLRAQSASGNRIQKYTGSNYTRRERHDGKAFFFQIERVLDGEHVGGCLRNFVGRDLGPLPCWG